MKIFQPLKLEKFNFFVQNDSLYPHLEKPIARVQKSRVETAQPAFDTRSLRLIRQFPSNT